MNYFVRFKIRSNGEKKEQKILLHFKYIKYRFTLKEKFLANETIHLRKHLRFITNKGFYHDFSVREPIVPSNVERSVLTYRRQRLPDYPSSFSNDPLSPSTWRTVSPEIGNRTIHMRGAHPFLDPKWSRIPASKRAPDAVEEAWQLWNPVWSYFAPDIPTSSPPAITIPFLFLVLSSSPARYFFLFSPSYRFIPRVNSGKEWREWNTFSLR